MYDWLLGANTGVSFLFFFIYLSFFLNFLRQSKEGNDYIFGSFLNKVSSILIVESILFVSFLNLVFGKVYEYSLFYFIASVSLSMFLFISPFVVRILVFRTSSFERTFLVMYGVIFVLSFLLLIVDYFLGIFSFRPVLVFVGMLIVFFEIFIVSGVYWRVIDGVSRVLSISFVLLPSLFSLVIVSNFDRSVSLIFNFFVLFFNLVVFVVLVYDLVSIYSKYNSSMENFSKKLKNESKIFSWFTVMLVSLLEARDPYTRGHSERVAKYSYRLARLVYNNTYIPNFVEMGALLHDIGKIGVRDEVLFYPLKLSYELMEEMKEHPKIGKELLSSVDLFKDISDIAYLHHEKLNGTGYPLGLTGKDIPKWVRISTIADSFDAMNSARVYKKSMDFFEIKKELIENSGTQFDKTLVDVFLKNVNRIV